ncbi:MAG: ankyrin repeat domain-containing protein [Phycisphaerae bacterium]
MQLRFAAFHGDLKLAKLLLDAGADTNLMNENGHTAFDYATKAGHTELAELLRPKSDS